MELPLLIPLFFYLMKQFLVLTSVCFALLTFNTSSLAQSRDKKTMELVMEVPNADPVKSFKALKKKLNTLPQVTVAGFCDSKKLLLLRLNPEQYFNVLVAVDEAGYTYYIKNNLHIAEVISECNAGDLYTKESSSLE